MIFVIEPKANVQELLHRNQRALAEQVAKLVVAEAKMSQGVSEFAARCFSLCVNVFWHAPRFAACCPAR